MVRKLSVVSHSVVGGGVPASLWSIFAMNGMGEGALVIFVAPILKPVFALELFAGHCVVPESIVEDILLCVKESLSVVVPVDMAWVTRA